MVGHQYLFVLVHDMCNPSIAMNSSQQVRTTPLRELRLSRGVTQAHMARELGIHRKTYENYEFGRTRTPKAVLYLAAVLLHVSPSNLVLATRRGTNC
jgi:DNA-binding XRE family transcriptional regulator